MIERSELRMRQAAQHLQRIRTSSLLQLLLTWQLRNQLYENAISPLIKNAMAPPTSPGASALAKSKL